MANRAGRVALFVLRHLVRAIWVSAMVLTPLFGFWLASSLAAYNNATQWLSLLVGLLLFPILPVGWDLFFVWRRRRNPTSKPPILTRLDRLVLRTLLISGAFLGIMMWQARASSFRALAVRGDWMLDGFNGPVAGTMRGWLLGFADHFDSRTAPNVDNQYGTSDKAPETVVPVDDRPVPVIPGLPDLPKPAGEWPLAVAFDPSVTAISDEEQASIESVGAYFASRITDKKLLVKALHDYVVNRLHYDNEALKRIEAKDYANVPAQTAEAVFARRAGVCEGYARLMVALGKASGVEIAYVTGSIRDSQRRLTISDDPWDTTMQEALEGVGHAWNAAKIDDRWYLIDATWDDPTGSENTTTYLFPPPRLLAFDHFPDDTAWQLLPTPLSLGEFVRQPMMSPAIGEFGMTLTSPTRSQITVSGNATIVLDNPRGATVSAIAHREKARDAEGQRCQVRQGVKTTITCELSDGEYEVQMFAAPASRVQGASRYSLDYIGSILVNSN